MQSINEELQSSNEELETSKEELQSVNEELATVNAELQNKLIDLSQANNDMCTETSDAYFPQPLFAPGAYLRTATRKSAAVAARCGAML